MAKQAPRKRCEFGAISAISFTKIKILLDIQYEKFQANAENRRGLKVRIEKVLTIMLLISIRYRLLFYMDNHNINYSNFFLSKDV